jgi:hypothetical protein
MKQQILTGKKLKAYSALAASAFATIPAEAQVMITDINPDVILESGQTYEIDFLGDSDADLVIINNSFLSGSVAHHSENMLVSGGSFAGYVATIDIYFFPLLSQFNSGETISAGMNWLSNLGIGYFDLVGGDGQWVNAIDKFAGFRINDGSDTYYGWVRMDVTQEPFTMVVKDYAYNLTSDEAIVTQIPVSIHAEEEIPAHVYFESNILYFQMYEHATDAILGLYNMNGESLLTKKVTSGEMEINLQNFAAGVYVVTVTANGQTCSSKLVLK